MSNTLFCAIYHISNILESQDLFVFYYFFNLSYNLYVGRLFSFSSLNEGFSKSGYSYYLTATGITNETGTDTNISTGRDVA